MPCDEGLVWTFKITSDCECFANRYKGHVGDQGGFVADIELELDLFVAIYEKIGVKQANLEQISTGCNKEWRESWMV